MTIYREAGNVIYGDLVAGRSGVVYENGIGNKRTFIPWDEIDAIYLGNRMIRQGGTLVSALYLKAVTRGKCVVVITENIDSGPREENAEQFDAMHEFVVSKISDRQKRDLFDSPLCQPKTIPFGSFDYAPEGIRIYGRLGSTGRLVPTCSIVGFDIRDGMLVLRYVDEPHNFNSEIISVDIVKIDKIPNFHIFQNFCLPDLYTTGVFLKDGGGLRPEHMKLPGRKKPVLK